MRRYFQLHKCGTNTINTPLGRYAGHAPQQAAKKCASILFRRLKMHGMNDSNEIIFDLREVTRGSRHRIYYYKATRHELEIPQDVGLHNGRDVTFRYRIQVKPRIHVSKTEPNSDFPPVDLTIPASSENGESMGLTIEI